MGLTGPQIKACTFDIPSLGSKLEALIELKIRDCGVKETEKCLLSACERILSQSLAQSWTSSSLGVVA